MEGLPEVKDVKFLSEKDQVQILYDSFQPLTENFKTAILSQVVVKGVRKALGTVATKKPVATK